MNDSKIPKETWETIIRCAIAFLSALLGTITGAAAQGIDLTTLIL